MQEPADVFVTLNSSRYWRQSDGITPDSPAPGYGLDYTPTNADDPSTPAVVESSHPCDARFLDVLATDDRVKPLWGLIRAYETIM